MAQTFVIHPVAAISQATATLMFTIKPVKIGIRPCDFEEILEEINDKIETYDYQTDAAIKAHQLETDTKLKSMQEKGKRAIIKSSFDKDFNERYQDDIKHCKEPAKLLQFLKNIIGVESAEQKKTNASKKLKNTTRHITEEEKFEQFLDRLDRIATHISPHTEVRKHLVEDEFRKNLSSENRAFLRDHSKSGGTMKEIAVFLDEKQRNKKYVSINAIDTSETTAELKALREQILAQSQQIQTLTILWQNKTQEIDETLTNQSQTHENLRLDVNKISARHNQKTENIAVPRYENRPLQNRNDVHSRSTPSNQQQQPALNQYPTHWEINRYGAPYRCRKCGVRGHRDFNCKGTDKSCDECGQIGHIKPACPKRQISQYGQRSTNNTASSLNY